MRPLERSYGDNSTRTRSPGTIRMKCLRIFPATCAITVGPSSSWTRNRVLASACVTVPSTSSGSSFVFTNLPLCRCSILKPHRIVAAVFAAERDDHTPIVRQTPGRNPCDSGGGGQVTAALTGVLTGWQTLILDVALVLFHPNSSGLADKFFWCKIVGTTEKCRGNRRVREWRRQQVGLRGG